MTVTGSGTAVLLIPTSLRALHATSLRVPEGVLVLRDDAHSLAAGNCTDFAKELNDRPVRESEKVAAGEAAYGRIGVAHGAVAYDGLDAQLADRRGC